MRTTEVLELTLILLTYLLIGFFPSVSLAQSADTNAKAAKPSVFHVKYVSEGTLYIDAGRNADLQEGMKLSVVNPPPDGFISEGIRYRDYPHVAELNVVSVSDSSAVCDVTSASAELKIGQIAFLTPGSLEDRHLAESAKELDDYPILVGFTTGDPADSELRSSKVENPNLGAESPVGVARARFGFSYGGISEGNMQSKQIGAMIDADLTHIGGTYWNFAGFWRGYLNTSSVNIPGTATGTQTQTLTDLLNRTYTIGFTYNNPYNPNILGVGRLYLPWAPSLSTIDGAYYGRRFKTFYTAGVFAGTTPDPASWSYAPDQQIVGSFVSTERGDFESFHIISTAGLALEWQSLKPGRQFLFFENNLNWKRFLSLYSAVQVDAARTSSLPDGGSNPTGISQTYNSLHIQPIHLVTFGVNYNYFRQLPTFNPALIVTGVLNQYLFTGLSGDIRFEFPKHISLYGSLGKSNATGDSKTAWNQALGITFANIGHTGLFFDAHYTKFNSSFGSGSYYAASLSKNLTDSLHFQLLGGKQAFLSTFTTNTNAVFLNATLDYSFARRYFVEGTFGWYQGNTMNYNQWSTLFGYRFGGLRK
jgi:hypothetical protein